MDLAYTLSGFVVGFIVGLTGVGGGSLMTPLLVLVFGVNPAIAVGTDLLYAAITKCGGILVHHKQRTIDWRIVRLMAAGSLPGAGLTLLALRHFQQEGMDYTALITSTLGVALILTSLVLLFKRQLLEFSYREPFQAVRAVHRQLKGPATVLVGLVIGVLVTLSSVGAGALGAAALFFLYPRLPAVSNRRQRPRPRRTLDRRGRSRPRTPRHRGFRPARESLARIAAGDLPGQQPRGPTP